MTRIRIAFSLLLSCIALHAQPTHELTISGTRFLLDGKAFPFTGMSFFNALYNPAFNKTSEDRRQWLTKFAKHGINVLRIWAQWDNPRGFVDACPECSLYYPDGRLRQSNVDRLKALLADADALAMVVELATFSHESYAENIRLGPAESIKAITELTGQLRPHRNLIIQVWNEHTDENLMPLIKAVRSVDPERLVTNSPGFGGVLGDIQQNQALDFLSPHTTRQSAPAPHWTIAPREIAYLLARFRKPVVDDEPARTGTTSFGGPRSPTNPMDHILQIWQVWKAGGYVIYHHDMFQTGYGSPACPPNGIPDPEFSPYHRKVFEFLAQRERYMPSAEL